MTAFPRQRFRFHNGTFGDDETVHAPKLSFWQLLSNDCTSESNDRVNILKVNRSNLCGPILMHALPSKSAAYIYGWVPHIIVGFLTSWLGSSYHGWAPHIMAGVLIELAGLLILRLGSSYHGWAPHIMAGLLISWLGSSHHGWAPHITAGFLIELAGLLILRLGSSYWCIYTQNTEAVGKLLRTHATTE